MERNLVSKNTTWLPLYSTILCFVILSLIFLGALVKSHDAGLSVPDWPNTYGYNMFTYPISLWVGGIFYEHSHRVLASLVGFLTVILAFYLYLKAPSERLKFAGIWAVILVVAQGVLGGITVIYGLPDAVSIAHGVLGQTFFLVNIAIAYFLWFHFNRISFTSLLKPSNTTFYLGLLTLVLIYLQLMMGAWVRHSESGLAVLDFPTTGGQILPLFDGEMLTNINAERAKFKLPAVTNFNVFVHFLHRLGGVLVFSSVLTLFLCIARQSKKLKGLFKISLTILSLTVLQFLLGILTIFSIREPWLTSLHVLNGAILLGLSFIFFLKSWTGVGISEEKAT
jgi:heme a synthase